MLNFLGFVKPFRTIEEVERRNIPKTVAGRISHLREIIRILVIDDQPFAPEDNLRSNGFNIVSTREIASIDQVAPFPIVMIDLLGVGLNFNPKLQGAHLITQVKRNFPEKYVIAYSGGARLELLAPSLEIADKFAQKDIRVDEWCDLLDDAILQIADPAKTWKKLRHRLLDSGITSIQVAHLEDELVSTLLGKSNDLQRRMAWRIDKLGLQAEARSLVTNLVASAIFRIIAG